MMQWRVNGEMEDIVVLLLILKKKNKQVDLLVFQGIFWRGEKRPIDKEIAGDDLYIPLASAIDRTILFKL